MMKRFLVAVVLVVLGAVPGAQAYAAGLRAQSAAATPAVYVNENGTDPAPLNLRELQGRVEGLGGEAMPQAQVALFSENGHVLLATAVSDREGKFHFDKVEKGLYRVVARVTGLCPANVPVKVESGFLTKRKMIITRRPKGLDTCSYGVAK